MKYIVYKTVCLVNNKEYIGVHQTENPDVFDGYLGRGLYIHQNRYINNPIAPFHYAVRRYGYQNFRRETLFVYDRAEEAYEKERELVDLEYVLREDTYNVALGGKCNIKIPKMVYQFDTTGKLLHIYESAYAASKILDTNDNNIRDAIMHKRTCLGCLWANQDKIDISEYTITIRNKYYLYDSNSDFVREFDTAKDCIDFLEIKNSSHLFTAVKCQHKINGYFVSTEKLDKFKVIVTPIVGKVNRYTTDGYYIDSFSTVEEARRAMNRKGAAISTAIKLNRCCGGYRWTRGDNPPEKIEVPIYNNRPLKVDMFDLDGNYIKTFNTVSEADKLYPGCRLVLKGKNKSSHGYIFKYH